MLTKEQVLTIHTHAQHLLSVCPTELLEHVLIILEQTEGAVKALDGFQWTEEADQSLTLTYQGQKMGRVHPVTHNGHEVYKGVVIHAYDQDSDSDEKFVCHNGFLDYAKMDVESFVKDILKARSLEVPHV